ncbi:MULTISPECIES: TraG family conjugative transposon ATPase [Alistipes]|uniref:TraG family conjugative transposon ATPase n=3 Tax=Rikenellaceae TaxID=171550 RepID=UPI0014595B65|nr:MULTISPECIES: TraG family conjugative transposon ATPase [Alistipes]MCI7140697.1 TraG family conjugative transposon ATPase [Alistipes sp.]MCI7307445.1 TraG family conjugative transposon ATPase [Alistipes senegalensis]MDY4089868.1 TraG family conjugative transposon ATPase [Alistipes finegoldii]NMF23341.1 TraG family conjugative transposon ATPase [Alistipes shahii]
MRGTLKTSTLESKFPLLRVENNCIISKFADITTAYRVTLPELFTLTGEEYEALHGAWLKALKVLPDYTVVHKQDFFIEERYAAPEDGSERSFLARSYERHFNERPYLRHSCYLYVTKTTPERMRQTSASSVLCRGFIVPREMRDTDAVTRFLEAAEQMERILNDSGLVRVERLTEDEIVGTADDAGLLARYFALSDERLPVVNEDIRLDPGTMRIGDKFLSMHTLSDLDMLPQSVATDFRYERLSTDRSDCRLSFAAPVGLLLSCNHVYNQVVFLDDHDETLKRLEATARNMNSLAAYSRSNAINREWIEMYLNEAHSQGLRSVRCHCNVMAWAENEAELKRLRNDVGSQLALMGCTPHHNTVDVPVLFWAAIPGNEADFPAEESFYTFLDQALCLFNEETNYRSSLSPFGIKMSDRLSGIPIHLDISDLPMKRGTITNRNKFILGPSGSGKSYLTNHLVRQYWEQGSHILLVDTGNSYQGLCSLIHAKTKGRDGVYFTYTEEAPIAFNPFYVEDGVYDVEKRESLKTLLLTLWKRESEEPTRSEEVALSNAVNLYLSKLRADRSIVPSFDTFYEFVETDYRRLLEQKRVREKDFDLANFLNVLEPYYKGGEYDYLLNSDRQLDLLDKRFIVFELDNISSNRTLLPVVTLIIMETFISKMRRLKGVRKMILIEECWKALTSANMSTYIRYLYKTVRKYFGEAVVVTQEVDDIISSPIVKESIINNADCKILLDQRKYLSKFDGIQRLLGLTDKEKAQILSINLSNDPKRRYKEVWIGLGGVQSAVYATETSVEEYLTYTTEESEKMKVMELAEKLGGDIEAAIRQLAREREMNPESCTVPL